MQKKVVLYLIMMIVLTFMVGYSIDIPGNVSVKNIEDSSYLEIKEELMDKNTKIPDMEKEIDLLKEKIKTMTLEEKIGQMLIVGFEGEHIDNNIKQMIEDHHVGGVILFSRNVRDSNQLLKLINSLKDINTKNNIPLFLSVDEEGGRVSRMPEELTSLPSGRKIGKRNDENLAYQIGSIIGKEIKAFGFNMNFAPVLDIDSNPQNPVIGDRSFGDNKEIVTSLGIKAMNGLKSQEVISVVKHFPGHGDTSVDSHIGLPKVDKDLNELRELELYPFEMAIANDVDAVMVAHIIFNEIDSQNPATLSKIIIRDLLRKELTFDGVVITDDMTMGAIMENYDIGDAAVRSVKAGSDILLISHGYDNQAKVLKDLKNAVENKIISIDRIDESVYRILRLKEKYNLRDEKNDTVNVDTINDEIRNSILR